jgi:hypothetical protein
MAAVRMIASVLSLCLCVSTPGWPPRSMILQLKDTDETQSFVDVTTTRALPLVSSWTALLHTPAAAPDWAIVSQYHATLANERNHVHLQLRYQPAHTRTVAATAELLILGACLLCVFTASVRCAMAWQTHSESICRLLTIVLFSVFGWTSAFVTNTSATLFTGLTDPSLMPLVWSLHTAVALSMILVIAVCVVQLCCANATGGVFREALILTVVLSAALAVAVICFATQTGVQWHMIVWWSSCFSVVSATTILWRPCSTPLDGEAEISDLPGVGARAEVTTLLTISNGAYVFPVVKSNKTLRSVTSLRICADAGYLFLQTTVCVLWLGVFLLRHIIAGCQRMLTSR